VSVTKDLVVDEAGRVIVDLSSPDAAHLRSEKVRCLIDDDQVVLRPSGAKRPPQEGRAERPVEDPASDDFRWWQENLDDLRSQYGGQWIAVRNKSVAAAGDSPAAVHRFLMGEEGPALVDFVPEQEEIETK